MRLIDADKLADRLTKMWADALQDNDPFGQGEMNALVGAIRAVNEAPTIGELDSVKEQEQPLNPQEPVTPIYKSDMQFCGACRYAIPNTVNYCHHCGRKVNWNS